MDVGELFALAIESHILGQCQILSIGIRLLGILLFAFLLWRADLSAIISSLSVLPWWLIAYVYIVGFGVIFCRSLRWRRLLLPRKFKIRSTFLYYYMGVFLRAFTPGSIGDFVKVLYLRHHGVSVGESVSTCVVDRLWDLASLIVLGIVGLLVVSDLGFPINRWAALGIVLAGILLIVGLIIQRSLLSRAVRFLYHFLVPARFKDHVKATAQGFVAQIKRLSKETILVTMLWTTLAWLVYFYQMHLLASMLGLPLSLFQVAVIMSFVNFVVLLPWSIAGIGTRDAALIALFATLGLGWEKALAFSILVLSTNLFIGLIGCVLWMFYPVKISIGPSKK